MPEGPRKTVVPFGRVSALLHPFNATLITSKGKDGTRNVMAVAWIIPVSVKPPLLTMSIRPERYSYKLIKETKEFVVNIPTFDMAEKVLLCGRRSGRDLDKFKAAKLTPRKASVVNVPLIEECVGHLECKLRNTVEAGDHDLFIGEVVAAHAIEGYFDDTWDTTKFRPCQHTGRDFFTTCSLETIHLKI